MGDGVAILELSLPGRPAERMVLAPKPLFSDVAIALAPRSSGKDWARWFRVVMIGHFTEGAVPPC